MGMEVMLVWSGLLHHFVFDLPNTNHVSCGVQYIPEI